MKQRAPVLMSFEPFDSAQRIELAERLADAWVKYSHLFDDVPHGMVKQLAALIELAGIGCDPVEAGDAAVMVTKGRVK